MSKFKEMMIRISRNLPPAATPITFINILNGLRGIVYGRAAIEKLEESVKQYFLSEYVFLVSSGKAALTVILESLKKMFPDRDEVLIPAFTCYSVPAAIIRAGLRIRLCDVDTNTFDFDYAQLSQILSRENRRLLCILPVHLFGVPSDVARIRNLIAGRDIVIVEDAAQAMGGESAGKKLGTLGDVGFFSLGRGKALSAVEGGIILTDRDDIASQISMAVKELGNYSALEVSKLFLYAVALMLLMRPSFFWIPKAIPFLRLGETIYDPDFKMRKLSAFQAGLAAGWEGKLHQLIRSRLLNSGDLLSLLENIGLRPTWSEVRPLPSLLRFPLKVEDVKRRGNILNISEQYGFGLAGTYPDSIDNIPELSRYFAGHDFPEAKNAAETLLTVPIHPYVTRNDLNRITKMLKIEGLQSQ